MVIICKNEKAVFVISYISNVYKFVWVPILRKSQICMLKKKSALSYKFVCVVTHRCGVNKSSYKSTNVLEKCQWPPSVVTRWGGVPGAVCVALEPVSYRGRLLGVVVTHRCVVLHPDCPVMMSGRLHPASFPCRVITRCDDVPG